MTSSTPKKGFTREACADADQAAEAAGRYLNDILSTHFDEPILLLLAGGSARAVFEYINPEYLTKEVTVSVTDERFTDDLDEHNFSILQTTPLYADLTEAEGFCINTSIFGDETVDTLAGRFNKDIAGWMKDFPKGKIVALYGVGADGHTAGIIPNLYKGADFEQRFLGDAHAVSVVDPSGASAFPERISTTLSFMKKVDYPIFYVTGEGKRAALEQAKQASVEDLPAAMMYKLDNAVLFTDIKE